MKYFKRNKQYKYELAEGYNFSPLFIKHTDIECRSKFITISNSTLHIKAGYAWDGSSIPLKRLARFASFGLYDPDKHCKTASLVHDAFYQLMRSELLSRDFKDAIDQLYGGMCMWGGMTSKQAKRRYWAVKKFGHLTLNPRRYPEKEILETE